MEMLSRSRDKANSRNRATLILSLSFLLLAENRAWANVPLPSLIGFSAPFFLSIENFGALYISIILVETVVIKFGLKWSLRKAGLIVTVANLISSTVGLVFTYSGMGVLLPLIAAPFLANYISQIWGMRRWMGGVICLAPMVMMAGWIFLTFPEGRGAEPWALYGSLIPAFLLTVGIEASLLRRADRKEETKGFSAKEIFRVAAIANFASYAMLAGFMFSMQKAEFMLTSDYLYMAARSAARAGNTERTLELIDRLEPYLIEEDESRRGHIAREEIKVARTLIRNGDISNARAIVERIAELEWENNDAQRWIEDEIALAMLALDPGPQEIPGP